MRTFARSAMFMSLGALAVFLLGPRLEAPVIQTAQAQVAHAAEAEGQTPPAALPDQPDVPPAAAAPSGTLDLGGATLRQEAAPWWMRLVSVLGMLVFLGLALLLCRQRSAINWRLVYWGLGLQLAFALFIFQPVWLFTAALAALVLGGAALRSDGAPLARRLRTPGLVAAGLAVALGLGRLLLPEGGALGQVARYLFIDSLGRRFFQIINDAVLKLLSFTEVGSSFLLRSLVDGQVAPALLNFVFQVLPTIIFFSSLMSVLYHLGAMQVVVRAMASIMQRTMGTSGAESMSAAANIFVGQTEAPLVVKPYIKEMTESELMAIMTGGFATVAGGVLAAYVGMLKGYFPGIAGHLMAASIMNAPAGLVLAKLFVPERETPRTRGATRMEIERLDANVIGAAARGASEGMQLVLNVAAMLLAFIALIAMLNFGIGLLGDALSSWSGMAWLSALALGAGGAFWLASSQPAAARRRWLLGVAALVALWWVVFAIRGPVPTALSMQWVFGLVLRPVAFLIGVPWQDAGVIGGLLGEKLVLNEFYAYAHLGQILQGGGHVLSERAVTLATYALLGFANFSSIAIQIGGIGGLAPERRADLARLGLRAMLAGTLAAYLSACVANILIP